MAENLDYVSIMNHAMHIFVQEVMQRVAKNGLPGDHHFLITLNTKHPNIEMAAWLKEKYPDEITIVMQHWYDNLEVGKKGFAVTLNFGDVPEPLYIPYDCIITFTDPSVEFGVRFEAISKNDTRNELEEALKNIGGTDPVENKMSTNISTKTSENEKVEAEIVQLDTFRKP